MKTSALVGRSSMTAAFCALASLLLLTVANQAVAAKTPSKKAAIPKARAASKKILDDAATAESPTSVFNAPAARPAPAPGWYYVPAPPPMPPSQDMAATQAPAQAPTPQSSSSRGTTIQNAGQNSGQASNSAGGQLTTSARRVRKAPATSLFRLTPVAGATVMGLKNDANDDVASPDVGLAVGGFLEAGRGIMTFQTGMIYNQFGGKAETPKGDNVYVLDYLSIPLMAKLNAMRNPDSTFYLKGGLMPSVLLDRKVKVNSTAGKDVEARTFDVAAVGGLGVALPVSRDNSLIFDAQYVRSVTNLTDDERLIRNEGFVFMGGISIGL